MYKEFQIPEKSKIVISSIVLIGDKTLKIKFTEKYHNEEVVIPFDDNDLRKSLEYLERTLTEAYSITTEERFEIEELILSGLTPTPEEADEEQENKSHQEKLIQIADEKINILFKDQYNETFAKIFLEDHFEIIPVTRTKFARFITKCYYEQYKIIPNIESINSLVNLLQAKAEFGKLQYNLYLRVAEYQGDFYYDLTDEKHRCIKISKERGSWKVLNGPPIPLFRRYSQTAQVISILEKDYQHLNTSQNENLDSESKSKENDKLEEFLSKLANIKDEKTKLLIKASIISYFIPDIPHIILLFHGPWGAAKTSLQKMIKEIVDPAKPSLLTFQQDKNEFLQQIIQNYLATFDNATHTPKWLPDEVCKTVTGIGHSKRALYTDDETKVYEFKHCLIFNGINIAFYEPDVLDRSIPIELPMIDAKDRRLERDVFNQFYKMKPEIMTFIFNTLAKAMTIYPTIQTKGLPRMADYALWCEAIARAMGYKAYDFLKAYDEIRGIQNDEMVDSNPIAYALKIFVESIPVSSTNNSTAYTSHEVTLFEGSPIGLLQRLNELASSGGIDITQRDWPKNRNWLIRKINIIKPALKQTCGIKIEVDRDTKNSSIIRIKKSMSSISGEYEISPANNSLSPFFEKISPGLNDLSPDLNPELSTISTNSGDTGYTGDNKTTTDKESIKTELPELIEDNVLEREEVFKQTRINNTSPMLQEKTPPSPSTQYNIGEANGFDDDSSKKESSSTNQKISINGSAENPGTSTSQEKTIQRNIINVQNMYRVWEGRDIWGCHKCSFRADKWDVKAHICKNNK